MALAFHDFTRQVIVTARTCFYVLVLSQLTRILQAGTQSHGWLDSKEPIKSVLLRGFKRTLCAWEILSYFTPDMK